MRKITLLVTFLLTFVAQGYAQLPESFEGETFPPAGWASFIGTNGAGTAQNWVRSVAASNTGAACAFVRWENIVPDAIAEDWLVTPQITVTAEAPALQFFQAQQFTDPYGNVYEVRISTTSQTNQASFNTFLSQTEADLPVYATDGFGVKQLDLSDYIGQSIYVAFVMLQDDGDNWFIDDVSMTAPVASVPLCASNPTPVDGAIDVSYGLVTFSWDAPTSGEAPLGYKLFYGDTPDDVTISLGSTTETSIDLNVQEYGFTFYWKVVPFNAAGDAVDCAVWTFTTEAANGECTNAPNGQYPFATYDIVDCDGNTENVITTIGYAGEYSAVNVSAGQELQFLSYTDENDDNITIALEDGTILANGISPLTWTSTVTGEVLFYSHVDTNCTAESEFRVRSIICTPTAALPDYASLWWPPNATINEGESVEVYGQVYEAGLTDVEPGLSGQAAGIEMWVAVNPENTDPSTWDPFNWILADFNAGQVSNNDEYFASIGADLEGGTYYYATRFRLDGGAYVYGGINQAEPNSGYFWDGVTYVNGILTVIPAPAPANDDCQSPVAITPAATYAAGLIDATNAGATTSNDAGPTGCFGYQGGDVWFSVVVPASGSITIETGDSTGGASGVDTVIVAYTGECGALVEVDCDDDDAATGAYSLLPLTGLVPGSTLIIRVYEYGNNNEGAFGISAYDASLSNGDFGRNGFTFHPNPVKDVFNLSHTQEITGAVVYNLLGQQVMTKSFNATQAQLDMSTLAKGAYLVKVAAGNTTETIKVIKE